MNDTTTALLRQAAARQGERTDVAYRLSFALEKEGRWHDAAAICSCRDWDELMSQAGLILSEATR